jgi:hypothetical protein
MQVALKDFSIDKALRGSLTKGSHEDFVFSSELLYQILYISFYVTYFIYACIYEKSDRFVKHWDYVALDFFLLVTFLMKSGIVREIEETPVSYDTVLHIVVSLAIYPIANLYVHNSEGVRIFFLSLTISIIYLHALVGTKLYLQALGTYNSLKPQSRCSLEYPGNFSSSFAEDLVQSVPKIAGRMKTLSKNSKLLLVLHTGLVGLIVFKNYRIQYSPNPRGSFVVFSILVAACLLLFFAFCEQYNAIIAFIEHNLKVKIDNSEVITILGWQARKKMMFSVLVFLIISVVPLFN